MTRNVREDALNRATSAVTEGTGMAAVALAIVYLGDQIRDFSTHDADRAQERIGVELGGIATSISDVATEIAHFNPKP